MTKTLIHRGPDHGGTWVDARAGIALGHRRLAILDLSSAGHQPMTSVSGRYVIVFNGEIYNHLEIRRELDALGSSCAWRGHSDTETLLCAFEHWGIERALQKSVGMFAFALWDRQERLLTLARDRMGEKPLYYGWQGQVFLFGSELKALRAHPAFAGVINRDVVALYMRHGYIGAPYSIYRGIFKLLPGTFIQFGARQSPGSLPDPKPYWSLREVAEGGAAHPFPGTDHDATAQLEALMLQAVSLQSIADVSLGAFLSGGIDSGTIVALMQAQSSRPVKTFTIGFQERAYDESGYAREVAHHLGTDHTELHISPREAMEVVPKLPVLYDEPFGDSSAIPTVLVAQLARQQVKVSLSGDGGDELFGGYSRYRRMSDIWSVTRRIPHSARKALSGGITAFARCSRTSSVGEKAKRLARYLAATSAADFYRSQILQRDDTYDLVLGDGGLGSVNAEESQALSSANLYDTMMYADAVSYLPDDILVKVDRAAMAVSLETRVPMLDHRVVEFAWRLPLHMKVRNGEGKWLLKQVLRKYLPASMVTRPKMGFGVPVGDWLRGPLRDWADNLLSFDLLKSQGLLNPQQVRRQWSRHIDGVQAGGDSLWQLLAFQAWLSDSAPLPEWSSKSL